MDKIRIGLTQGDVNGVGAEVIVKALGNPDILELFTPVIFGMAEVFRQTAETLDIEEFKFSVIKDGSEIEDGRINLVDVTTGDVTPTPGRPSEEGGRAAVKALDTASNWIEKGEIDLLVTAPIDKHSSQGENFKFPGHTEFLEDRFRVGSGKALMILASEGLRVALVTTHVPVAEVASKITKEKVEESIKGFNSALRMDFGCERPKIAVLSLNPHCGDGGVLGRDEEEKIIPAIEACRKEGLLAFGPIAADGLFGSGSYKNFDGVLAMYHDQGLAPFKALSGPRGVNFTAGLNIVRTSPAHGTAYDIAGKGIADETSMREAIYAAIDIARRRDRYLVASESPLKISEKPAKESRARKQDAALPAQENVEENG